MVGGVSGLGGVPMPVFKFGAFQVKISTKDEQNMQIFLQRPAAADDGAAPDDWRRGTGARRSLCSKL